MHTHTNGVRQLYLESFQAGLYEFCLLTLAILILLTQQGGGHLY